MKDILKTGIILLIICVVAALALGLTNEVTKDKIADQRKAANELAKKNVLPVADSFKDIEGDELKNITDNFLPISEAYVGLDASGNIIGYVFKSLPNGFSGAVEVVTGISVDGIVTGLRVGAHKETPGLGAKATDSAYYEQYTGKVTTSPIGVLKTDASGNDIQAITGATISSVAITAGANASIDAFNWILENGGTGN